MIDHDGGPLDPRPTKIVATWDEGFFVENVAVAPSGRIFVSVHSESKILEMDPASYEVTPFTEIPVGGIAGLAFDADGRTLWVTAGVPGESPGSVWRVEPNGTPTLWANVDKALFLNGCTLHPDGRTLLIAESFLGQVVAVCLRTRRVSVWLSDELLLPVSVDGTPGCNGIKVYAGHVYLSSTDRNLLLRARILPDGSAGRLETVASHLRADDFAFDTAGNMYVATHPVNTVMRLTPDGRRTTLAGPKQGLAGSTAVAFGRSARDKGCIYVTTTGGIWAPFEGKLQRAKLVRIDVGAQGLPLTSSGGGPWRLLLRVVAAAVAVAAVMALRGRRAIQRVGPNKTFTPRPASARPVAPLPPPASPEADDWDDDEDYVYEDEESTEEPGGPAVSAQQR